MSQVIPVSLASTALTASKKMSILQFLLPIMVTSAVFAAPFEDLIVDLPGANFIMNYNQYSGYLQATEGKFLHYWLIESQNDPATDPLVLWLNGGPACSSLIGLLTENGPFYVDQDGSGKLHQNPYSWNKIANMLYLESPACIGFSYDINHDCKNGDNSTATQNYIALQDFFAKFPEYRNRDLFLTGESYAGIYIPMLSQKIIDGNDSFPINFQGFAIGNGCLDVNANHNSLMFFAYYHAVFGDELWNKLVTACCNPAIGNRQNCEFSTNASISVECRNHVDEALYLINLNGLNPYNLYSECSTSGTYSPNSRMEIDIKSAFSNLNQRPVAFQPLTGSYDPACSDNAPEKAYLNDPATREALHIFPNASDWVPCNDVLFLTYTRDIDNYSVDLVAYAASVVRGLIYSGDVDMVCNYLGNQWDIEGLNLPVVENRRQWTNKGQIAGYVKRFKNLDFLTFKGAGHMVPGYMPQASLHMINSFLFQQPY